MTKVTFKVVNSAKLSKAKMQIKNSLSEVSEDLRDALLTLIETLESDEREFDINEFKGEIERIIAEYPEVTEPVANALTELVKNSVARAYSAVPKTDAISGKVRNEIAAAVLRSKSKEDVRDAVNAVLVKNDITGFTFSDVVDFAVVTDAKGLNPLFDALRKVPFTKFFYSDLDMATATAIAKQWDKSGESEKKIQQLEVIGKVISPAYIYKRQRAAFEDLDAIEESGEMPNFMRFINEELDRQIVNTIVMAILIGDQVNAAADKVTTFESIGTKTASDLFTSVVNPAVAGSPSVEDVRATADKVVNPEGKSKWLIISQQLLTNISAFVYAAGGTTDYRSIDVMKGVLGVDEIFVTDILANLAGTHAIVMLPDGYWYKERKALEVAYPTYERNSMNYQKERNAGGAIHDLYSTAVLKEA